MNLFVLPFLGSSLAHAFNMTQVESIDSSTEMESGRPRAFQPPHSLADLFDESGNLSFVLHCE